MIKKLLATLGLVSEKTGLTASIRNQCQRLVCLLTNDNVPREQIKPGTPLLVDLFGIVEHSGIYLGNGLVAELYGDNLLRQVPLKEFIEGDSRIRTGNTIYAACSKESGLPISSINAALNARAYIQGIRTVEYDLIRNNCHLFSISCISGIFQEKRKIVDALSKGGISIGVLTTAISYFINKSKIVVWKPVKGWERKNLCHGVSFNETSAPVEPLEDKDRDRNIAAIINKYSKNSADLPDETQCARKIQETRQGKHKGIFAPCIPLFYAAYRAIKNKELHLPKTLIALLLTSIGYFFFPIDLIPDPIPVFGFGDDAIFILYAIKKLLPYVPIPDDGIREIMRADPGFEWIHTIGNPECIQTTEYSETKPSKNFKITKKLLSYFIKRFNLEDPQTSYANDMPYPTDSNTTEVGLKYGWKIFKVPGNWLKSDCYLINDPFDNTWIKKRNENEIKLTYTKFIKWYSTKLLPAILDNQV